MENNPIKYTDLVSPDVEAGFDALIGKLNQLKTEGENACNAIKKGLSGAVASSANVGGASKPAQDVQTLIDAYKSLKVDVDMYKDAIDAVNKSERERKNVLSALQEVDRAREDSYDQLSAKYRALKILVNNLTEAERTNSEQGKKMVDDLRLMYEQMNALQQATGKYQLQVGNYSKAISGLNIATTQVMREMPALANSPATFAIAISNNIPILVDYIGKVRQLRVETLEQIKAAEAVGDAEKAASLKAEMAKNSNLKVTSLLVKSIFSWQTALLAVLTVLPMVLRKISAKNKAMQEGNDILSKQINLEEQVANADLKAAQSAEGNTAKLRVLYKISQDTTRSLEDRANAVKALQQIFPNYFGNLSTETILQGDATAAYDKATEALIRRAKASAYLDEITKAEKEKIEYEKRYNEERVRLEEDLQKAEAARATGGMAMGGQFGSSYYVGASSDVAGVRDELKKLDAEKDKFFTDTAKYVDDLTKKIYAEGFLESGKGGAGAGGKAGKPKVFDFDFTLSEQTKKDWSEYLEVAYEDIDAEIIKVIKAGLDNEKALRDDAIYQEYEDRKTAGENIATLKKDIDAQLLESDRQYWQEYLKQLSEAGVLTTQQYEQISAKLYSMDKSGTDTSKRKGKGKKYGGIVEAMMAYSSEYGDVDTSGYKIVKEEYSKYAQAIDSALSSSINYMGEWMDARVQMAEIAVECAEKEMNAAKTSLDYEMQARANGYANSVETAQKEYENKRKIAQKAAEDAQELQRIQELTDTAQQVSSLVTATANIWSAESIKGLAGVPLAATATGLMWAAFTAAKIKAAQLSRAQTETYGEGMSEYLDYGGSHSSGHDIDFGTTKNGTRRRVERGEMIGVINKRNVRKYGVNKVSDIISSLNHGDFENKYGNAFAGVEMINGSGADLTRLERGVNSLVEQGNTKVVNVNGKTITMYKNTKRIIRS